MGDKPKVTRGADVISIKVFTRYSIYRIIQAVVGAYEISEINNCAFFRWGEEGQIH